jgi:hypothetical protein
MKLHLFWLMTAWACTGPAMIAWSQQPEVVEESAPIAIEDDEKVPADAKAPAAGDELAIAQARLADRYKRLEEILSQLAELSAASDPNRARILRQAIAQSREQDINVRFEAIVKLLEEERLAAATNNQVQLRNELDALLELLLKADRDKELASQRDRVREYLKELGRLIRMQKGIRARTEGGDHLPVLAEDQQRAADATGKLGGTIKENESDGKNEDGSRPEDESTKDADKKDADKKDGGKKDGKAQAAEPKNGDAESSKPREGSKPGEPSEPGGSSKPSENQPSDGKQSGEQQPSQPSESQPSPGQHGKPSQSGESDDEPQPPQPQDPAERATQRLGRARQRMEDARMKLEEAKRDRAVERQKEALAELERAKADLERILHQLREEEMERLLTQLAARFRKMLELQNAVYEGTIRLDKVDPAARNHDHEIEAARLSRQESLIAREAEKALLLLKEEGSSVAFPEVIDQMHGDMQSVAERLAAIRTDKITQGLEEDIIAALEETIAALEKAAKDLEKRRAPPGQGAPAGEPGEPPLVNKLQELKMIRSLQVRINTRTVRYGEMIGGDQAETPELLAALEELATRQQRVYQATYDLSQSRND